MFTHQQRTRWLGVTLMCLGVGALSAPIWFYGVIADPVQYERMILSSRIPLGSGPFLLFATALSGVGGLGLTLFGVSLAVRNSPVAFRKLGVLMILSAAAMSGMALLGLLY